MEKITYNKDGTPRKKWTQKNPRKNPAKSKYYSIRVSLKKEDFDYVLDEVGEGKAPALFRSLLDQYKKSKEISCTETKEELISRLLDHYTLPGADE